MSLQAVLGQVIQEAKEYRAYRTESGAAAAAGGAGAGAAGTGAGGALSLEDVLLALHERGLGSPRGDYFIGADRVP